MAKSYKSQSHPRSPASEAGCLAIGAAPTSRCSVNWEVDVRNEERGTLCSGGEGGVIRGPLNRGIFRRRSGADSPPPHRGDRGELDAFEKSHLSKTV